MPKVPKVILLIEDSRTYGRQLLRGVARYAHLYGPWTFYRQAPFYIMPGLRKNSFDKLKVWGADGMILRDHVENCAELLAMNRPAVVCISAKGQIPGLPYVLTDNVAIGRMAAEHLLNRGFKNFGYCGFDDLRWSQQRSESFRKRVKESGFETSFYSQPRAASNRSWEGEQVLIVDWLKSLPKPVGVLACNDDRAQNVTEACKTAGLHVPAEVAVIGVDNDDLICGLSEPPISSIALNVEKAGYRAAELLDRLMAGKEKMAGQTIIVEPLDVVTRQSTDVLAIEDPEVAAAVHFIHQNCREPLQVDNVVDATTMSRRALERRFRKIVGRSIHDEIRRVRIAQVTRMLLETNLSVSQIASALNFPGHEHIGRYFRREKGVSPLAYRNHYSCK
jgi:LacI family transcriptional regulator